MQCNRPFYKCLLQVENMHARNADTSLAEIHKEMSELFDKQVNIQKRVLRKTFGVYASSCKPTKVCDENETKEENNDGCVKMFLMKGRSL